MIMVTALFVLGLCFGSFVSASVWRFHEQSRKKKLSAEQKRRLSILRGRSMCVHCRHALAWYDLLPLVSWLSLRGKCRYCHNPIDDNPLVELLTGLLFVLSYVAWPYTFGGVGTGLFICWLVTLVGFVFLMVYDLRWMLLPNPVVFGLMGVAGVQVLLRMIAIGDARAVLLDALAGVLAIAGPFYLLFQASRGRWIGGGDVRLGVVIGLLVGGPLSSIMVLFLASVFGTLYALPMMARRAIRPTSRIPFGPFLLAATIVVFLYGSRIGDWYISVFL